MGDDDLDNKNNNNTESEKFIQVTVKTQKEQQKIDTTEDTTVQNFKTIIAEKFNANVENLLLIFAGKVMKDNKTLKDHNVENGFTIHLVVKTTPPQVDSNDNNGANQEHDPFFASFSGMDSPLGALFGMGGGVPEAYYHTLLDENAVRTIMAQIPQIQTMIESNPEFSQILNNPQLIRQTLNMASNPGLMQEMMRQQDRAMSNIESIPGGSQFLEQMFRNVQEPMMNAMDENLIPNRYTATGPTRESSGNVQQGTENRDALPNPWQQNVQSPNPPANEQSRINDLADLFQRMMNSTEINQDILTNQMANQNPDSNTDALAGLLGRLRATLDQQQPQNLTTYEERYAAQLDQLTQMGFPNRDANLRALILTFGTSKKFKTRSIKKLACLIKIVRTTFKSCTYISLFRLLRNHPPMLPNCL